MKIQRNNGKNAQLSDSYFEIYGLISSWRRLHILSIHDVSCDCGLGVDRLTSAINIVTNYLQCMVGTHVRPGVAWQLDSVTNLPLVKYCPWQSNTLVGLCPWKIYLPCEISTPLLKKRTRLLCFFHIHEYWILLRLFGWYKSDFQADHICCPIHIHNNYMKACKHASTCNTCILS